MEAGRTRFQTTNEEQQHLFKRPLVPASQKKETFVRPDKENERFAPNNAEVQNLPVPTKQSAKTFCHSPPSVIKDKKATFSFTKGKFLGEGGFARCYEVFDATGKAHAAKIISKASLKSQKSKQKLFAEIKIHQNMKHPRIVNFNHVFEDSSNVYMILELCENKTFVELMKKKKRLSEPEARFYAGQILEAITYMHKKRVIHRDLKLGNLFFNEHMDIKVGDFGLATVLAEDEERKKTICGTPNYIAPEILFDRKNGHSFEVDIWSFGVIVYTMLFGRPPFQTKDVQEIYRKIRENEYEFPPGVNVSPQAKDLVSTLLVTNPALRPNVVDISSHSWFRNHIPAHLTDVPVLSPRLNNNVMTLKPRLSLKASPCKDVAVKSLKRDALTPMKPVSNNVATPKLPEAFKGAAVPSTKKVVTTQNVQEAAISLASLKPALEAVQFSPPTRARNGSARKSMLETMFGNIDKALNHVKYLPADFPTDLQIQTELATPRVFISKWIDYSNKYGLGYQLTNGSVGVYFNDSTSIILCSNEKNFEYLEYASGSEKTVMNRQGFKMTTYPESLEKKVTLLKYFRNYMHENLSKASQHCFSEPEKTVNLDFLVKYMRTKHAVLFRLSNNTVQVNFFDHSKLILAHNGLVVSYIDKNREMHTTSLYDIFVNQKQDITSRLKYTKEILENLLSNGKASGNNQQAQ